MQYLLEIKPAIPVEIRHKIESLLESEGFDVLGGGTCTDESACDINFRPAALKSIKEPTGE